MGFDIWIDVLDPYLTSVATVSNFKNAVATAIIVEMALLNCSHVLAVMTDNTSGSFWVPYEYGRIKERIPFADNVTAWFDASNPPGTICPPPLTVVNPEYLCLGHQLHCEPQLRSWQDQELLAWRQKNPGRALFPAILALRGAT